MKKLTGVIAGLFLVVAMAAPADAQTVAGGGLVYAADAPGLDLGIQGGVYVGMDQVASGLRIGGDLEYYFVDDLDFLAINANAHYMFVRGPVVDFYGLGGLGIGRASAGGVSNTDVGLNIGIGLELPLTFARFYSEAKVVTGDYDRIALGAGLRVGL